MSVEHPNKNRTHTPRRDYDLYERILLAWVNLPCGDGRLPSRDDISDLIAVDPKFFQGTSAAGLTEEDLLWIVGVNQHLKAAWMAQNQQARQFYLYRLRDMYMSKIAVRDKILNPEFAGLTPQQMAAAILTGKPAWVENIPANKLLARAEMPTDQKGLDNIGWGLLWENQKILNTFMILEGMGVVVAPLPPQTDFDDLLAFFLTISNRALRCSGVGCRRPFFFKGEGVRTQSYCADCQLDATHRRQNKYWARKGNDLRKKRIKQAKRTR